MRNQIIALGMAALALGAAATSASAAGQTPLGMTVAYQAWTPQTDNDTPAFLFRQPTMFSDTFNLVWQVGEPIASKALTDILQKPDLVMKGITFYNVKLDLHQPVITFGQPKCASMYNTPCTVDVQVALTDERLTLTSTTPSAPAGIGGLVGGVAAGLATGGVAAGAAAGEALGHGLPRSADPTCTGAITTTLHFTMKIQGAAGSSVFSIVPAAKNDPPPVVHGPSITGLNTSCKVVVDALAVSGLDDKIADMLNDPHGGAGVQLRDTVQTALIGTFNQLGSAMNAGLAAVSNHTYPLQAASVWVVPYKGGQTLVLNFAPRGPFFDSAATAGTGRLNGVVNVSAPGGTLIALSGGDKGSVYCDQIPVLVTRKTGPRPMLSPDGQNLGDAPVQTLTPHMSCTPSQTVAPGQSSRYTITGLSPLFPQFVSFGSVSGNCNSGAGLRVSQGTRVTPGWDKSAPLLQRDLGHDQAIGAQLYSIACGSVAPPFESARNRFDKVIDPGDVTNVTPGAVQAVTGKSNAMLNVLGASRLDRMLNRGAQVTQTATVVR